MPLWLQKYRPRTINEIVGNTNAVNQFADWVSKRLEDNVKKAALLYGPPGVGKSLTVQVYAEQFGFDLIELNASDVRAKEQIMKIAGTVASQPTLFGGIKRLVFLDEIDGINPAEDRGCVPAIIDIINKSSCPVVLAANDPWIPELRPIRDLCILIRYNKIRSPTIVKFLKEICRKEGIVVEDRALTFIAEKADGDLRSAIIDLQILTEGRRYLRFEDLTWLPTRNRQYGVFDVLKELFWSKTALQARLAIEKSLVDHETLKLWIHENLPLVYSDLNDLVKAYDMLSKADVFFGRMNKTQNWDLLSYALEFMTAGVILGVKKKPEFVKYQFPQKLLLISSTRDSRRIRDEILLALSEKCRLSRRKASTEILPYLKVIIEGNPSIGKQIGEWLNLGEDHLKYLGFKTSKLKKA
ncbi:MAG: replication factor C large subunit [Candidatus Methanomethylicia archaeon]